MIGQINRLLFTPNPVRYRALTANSAFFLNRFDSILVRNMSLLLNKTLINGNWVSSETNEQLAVLNPVNGEIVGQVPDLNAADTQKALQAANDAFYSDEWTKLTAKDRSGLLKVCIQNTLLCGVCVTQINVIYFIKCNWSVSCLCCRNGFNCWNKIVKRLLKL